MPLSMTAVGKARNQDKDGMGAVTAACKVTCDGNVLGMGGVGDMSVWVTSVDRKKYVTVEICGSGTGAATAACRMPTRSMARGDPKALS